MGTVIVGLTNVLATFIAIGLVDRWGRKPTLILGFIVMAAGMGVLGTMMHIGIHSSTAQYIAVLMLLMFIVGFAMSAGPLIWVLCSEIQPLKGRDFGITCSTATNWIANMIVGATFRPCSTRWQRQYLLGVRRSERAVYPADAVADPETKTSRWNILNVT